MTKPKGETTLTYKELIQNEVDAVAERTGEKPRDVRGMTLEKARAYAHAARRAALPNRGRKK